MPLKVTRKVVLLEDDYLVLIGYPYKENVLHKSGEVEKVVLNVQNGRIEILGSEKSIKMVSDLIDLEIKERLEYVITELLRVLKSRYKSVFKLVMGDERKISFYAFWKGRPLEVDAAKVPPLRIHPAITYITIEGVYMDSYESIKVGNLEVLNRKLSYKSIFRGLLALVGKGESRTAFYLNPAVLMSHPTVRECSKYAMEPPSAIPTADEEINPNETLLTNLELVGLTSNNVNKVIVLREGYIMVGKRTIGLYDEKGRYKKTCDAILAYGGLECICRRGDELLWTDGSKDRIIPLKGRRYAVGDGRVLACRERDCFTWPTELRLKVRGAPLPFIIDRIAYFINVNGNGYKLKAVDMITGDELGIREFPKKTMFIKASKNLITVTKGENRLFRVFNKKLEEIESKTLDEFDLNSFTLPYFSEEVGFLLSKLSYNETAVYVFNPSSPNADQLIILPHGPWSISAKGNRIYIFNDQKLYEGRLDPVEVKEVTKEVLQISWKCPIRPSY
ncbi:hypothetical protein IPA_00975 [Ignicoccus pacificus DSM 13166]|uniref:Uncharacterized protein n=1 Tax=Ignicoccus pacificus DSM 13166 TaxID=940294 RepID=A0A977KAH8_9CREN|nr:hypothetical protein IPA_00975 [Ignicoccus pacificus DSM 13166]